MQLGSRPAVWYEFGSANTWQDTDLVVWHSRCASIGLFGNTVVCELPAEMGQNAACVFAM